MRNNWPILVDILIIAVIATLAVFLYKTYKEPVMDYLLGGGDIGIYVRDVPLRVSVADTAETRQHGLSGVESMEAEEGMLFVFDSEGDYLFWMKDMKFPIDILWVNNELEIVYVEKNVKPDSFPTRYGSPKPARFVIETNAFFAESFNVNEGDKVRIPKNWLPQDLRD